MDSANQDGLRRRAQVAQYQAQNALDEMFCNFGVNEDSERADRQLTAALAREQATWIAAYGSPKLRELAALEEKHDAAGRLVYPWLSAAGVVGQRVAEEWGRGPLGIGHRPPGHEWGPFPSTPAPQTNPFGAWHSRRALARCTADVEAIRLAERNRKNSGDHDYDRARELHAKLTAALSRERRAWTAAHGSRELKNFDKLYQGSPDAYGLSRMRQLGAEWLAKEYPGWRFVNGYRADGHRPTLGSDGPVAPYLGGRIADDHRRSLESALGNSPAAALMEAKRVDPAAELAAFAEPSSHGRGPYVFAAVVERRLPGAWVSEPLMLVFEPQVQRELNARAERELGAFAAASERNSESGRRRVGGELAPTKMIIPRQQTEGAIRSPFLSTKETAMDDSPESRARQLDALRDALKLQYQKPVLPVPQGECVEGRVVAVVGGGRADTMRAVIEADRALYIIGVGADAAREALGARVSVDNEHGKLRLTTCEPEVRVDLGGLLSLLERKAIDAGSAATFACDDLNAQRAIGAEAAYRDVLAQLQRPLSREQPGHVAAQDRSR